ncbi:unnamed protein product, partial [Effrenium voratum]
AFEEHTVRLCIAGEEVKGCFPTREEAISFQLQQLQSRLSWPRTALQPLPERSPIWDHPEELEGMKQYTFRVPRHAGKALDAAQLEAYHEQGFLLNLPVLQGEALTEATQCFEELLQERLDRAPDVDSRFRAAHTLSRPLHQVVEDNHPPPAQEVVEDNHPPPAQEVVEDQGEADAVAGKITVAWLCSMTATRPEIVRSIPACCALQMLGRIFWIRGVDERWYEMSSAANRIQEFWSHSWQLHPWRKILTLLVLKNGLPAAVFGFFGAVVGCLLCIFRVLPVGAAQQAEGQWYYAAPSLWSTGLGWAFYLVVLLAWRDQSSTFLDRMCINQSNTQLKSEGVASIGAFLRMSETMLVLWDVTYVKRLWCLFEVAAFIRSRPDSEKCDLAIVPTHTGPVCLVFNVGVSLVFILCWILLVNGTVSWRVVVILPAMMIPSGQLIISNMRAYVRDVKHMLDELATLALQECIVKWFGSKDAFIHAVRSVVLPAFAKHFGRNAVPLWIFQITTAPACWTMLDLVAGYAITERELGRAHFTAAWWLLFGCGLWLGIFPTCCAWLLFWSRQLSRDRGGVLNFAVNMFILALAAPMLCLMVAPQMLTGVELVGHWSPVLASAVAGLQILIGLRDLVHHLATHERVLAIVEDVREFCCWSAHLFCKLPSDPTEQPWHQDAGFWPLSELAPVQGLEAMVFDIEFWLAAAELQSSPAAPRAKATGKRTSQLRPESRKRQLAMSKAVSSFVLFTLAAGELFEPATPHLRGLRQAQEACLCVFDIDRTLTGKQQLAGPDSECPNNLVTQIWDTAYGGGYLTLSHAAQHLNQTFCQECLLGVVSAGDAGGENSPLRSFLLNQVLRSKAFDQLDQRKSAWSLQQVNSPLVLGWANKLKQDALHGIVAWYSQQGFNIIPQKVHFFGDRHENIPPFRSTPFNAREISCAHRDQAGDVLQRSSRVGFV